MNFSTIKASHIPHKSLMLMALISLGLVIAGIYYYKAEKGKIKKEKNTELTAIADLKIKFIENWQVERRADAETFHDNNTFHLLFKRLIDNPKSQIFKKDMMNWIEPYRTHYDYYSIQLCDLMGKKLLTIGSNNNDNITKSDSENIKQATKSDTIVFSDIQKDEQNGRISLNTLIPIKDDENNNNVIGVLVLKIDPNIILYPLIQAWPDSSLTSETIFVRRSGDSVLFLNEPRGFREPNEKFKPKPLLEFMVPLSDTMQVAVKAIYGWKGLLEALDYKQDKVLAVINPIPTTNWFLITKINLDEIYYPIIEKEIVTLIGTLVLIAMTVVLFLFLLKQRKLDHYKVLYNAELELNAVTEKYEVLTKYASDIILLADENNRIIDANKKAIDKYKYSLEEIKFLNIKDIRSANYIDDLDKHIKAATRNGGALYEIYHRDKDGNEFPVEVSAKSVIIHNNAYTLFIIRDITDRNQAQEILKKQKNFYEILLENIIDGVCVADNKDIIYWQNKSMSNLFKTKPESYTGKKIQDVFNELLAGQFREMYESVKIDLKPKRYENLPFSVSSDLKGYVSGWIVPIVNDNQITNIIYTCENVTEKYIMEQKIVKLNRVYSVLSNINQAIVRIRDVNELFSEVCRTGVIEGNFKLVSITLKDHVTNTLFTASHYGGENGFKEKFDVFNNIDNVDNLTPVKQAIWYGRNHYYNRISYNSDAEPWMSLAYNQGIRSVCSIPLISFKEIIGAVTFFSSETEFFDDPELKLLNELAQDIGYSLEFINNLDTQQEMMEELHSTNDKLSALVASSPLAIITMDPDGRVETWNPAAERIFGWTAEEAIGVILPYVNHDMINDLHNILNQLKKGVPLNNLEIIREKKDKSLVNINLSTVPLFDNDGNIVRILSIMDDITKRKSDEVRILEDQFFIKHVTEVVPMFISILNIEYLRKEYSNRNIMEILGYPPHIVDENKNHEIEFLIHPKDKPRFLEHLEKMKIINDDEVLDIEFRVKSYDGSWRWFQAWDVIFKRNDNGIPIQILGALEDITSRKEMENEINIERNKFKSILDTMPDGVYIVDKDFSIQYINPILYKEFGDVQNKPCYSYFNDFQQKCEWCHGDDVFNGSIFNHECQLIRNDKIYDMFEAPLLNPDGTTYKLQIIKDITDRKTAEAGIIELNRNLEKRVTTRTLELQTTLEELKFENDERRRTSEELLRANEEIEKMLLREKELNELKSRFVSMVSHEFRTPLTGIMGGITSLRRYKDRMDNAKQDEYFNDIESSVVRLTSMLNEVLYLSRYDAKKMPFSKVMIDLKKLCEKSVNDSLSNCDNRKVNFMYDGPASVIGDPNILDHIISNLLTNAIKYSESDVDFTVFVNNKNIHLTFRDEGIGIPDEDRKNLFDSFFRCKNVKNIKGSGLGLSIVKRSVETYGGSIEYESKLNEGTTFKIQIPNLKQ
jgi:PAS domain S-box-containing protein